MSLQVVVTGAGSALGQALLRELAARGTLARGDGVPVPITRILAVDRIQPAGLFLDARIEYIRGEYDLPRFLSRVMGATTDSVFHLAVLDEPGTVEDPFDALDLALAHGVDTTRALLDACRYQSALVKIVLAGAAGPWDGEPASAVETCAAMCELLLREGARRNLIDARCVRLPVAGGSIDGTVEEAARQLIEAHDAMA